MDDIEGAQAHNPYYSKTLHKVPTERDLYGNVKDITGVRERREPYIMSKELMMDVTDIAYKREIKSSNRDPLVPVYDWKQAERPYFLDNKRQQQLDERDVYKDSFIYNTHDLVGGER